MNESRRDFIRKAAVGGGVVWASPVIQSVTSAASAAGTPEPSTSTTVVEPPVCTQCAGDFCFGQTTCGHSGPVGRCGCSQRVDEPGCFCHEGAPACVDRTPCPNGQSDCPSGQFCLHSCCDELLGYPVCLDPCNTTPASATQAPANSGQGSLPL
jgi:hypothetical protein